MYTGEFASFLGRLDETSSRIEITKILADLFNRCGVDEVDKITYMLLGSLSPRYKSNVFNIADKMMIRAIAKASGRDLENVTAVYKKEGDLGLVAQKVFETKKLNKQNPLTVTEIYKRLSDVALADGEGSQEDKVEKMAEILALCDNLSIKYLVRIPLGKLRLGFSDKTIMDALSWMETGDKSKKTLLEEAYNVLPDVGLLAKHVKENGIAKTVRKINPMLGVPLLPALAARLKSPKEMVEKMGEVAVEPKYDGLRIQIHYKKDGFEDGSLVKAFTRNLNETSWMFPELKDFGESVDAEEAIFDSEAMGVDEERKTMANFQTTMTRRRKHDIEDVSKKVGIKFFIFDCMYKDGKSLINQPYIQRRDVLASIHKNSQITQEVEYTVTTDPERISELMKENIADGLEGIIVKRTDSNYVAGRTGWRWVKMKEAETARAKLSDTIDAVVMGYYRGRGKRTGFGLGGFLVGITEGEVIKTLTKIGTGLTDEQFRQLKKRLGKFETLDKPKVYGEVNKILVPDVWVEPALVVEIAADEITKSPTHSSGYALRFPRLITFRDDKNPSEATTKKELESISIK